MSVPIKVYMHYEGDVGHAFTLAKTIGSFVESGGGSDSTEAAINQFIIAYNCSLKNDEQKLEASRVELRNSNGNVICGDFMQVLVSNREDIFVVDCSPREIILHKSVGLSTPSPVVAAASSSASTTSTTTSKIAPSSSSSPAAPQPLVDLRVEIEQIEKLITAKSYRQARQRCEKLIAKIAPRQDGALFMMMAQVMYATKKFEAAVDYSERAIAHVPFDFSTASKTNILLLQSKSQFENKQFDEAYHVLVKCLKMQKKDKGKLHFEIISLQAECLFELGQHSDAADLLNSVMSDPLAESCVPLLLAYSYFAMQYSKVEEPMRALLKAVVLDQTNHRARALLATLIESPGGMDELKRQLAPNPQSARAYAFIATIAKEFSCFNACIGLLSLALLHRPNSASYALNLAHVQEILCDYDAALLVLTSFLRANVNGLRVGKAGFTCRGLLEAITRAPHSSVASSAPSECDHLAPAAEGTRVVGHAVSWVDDGDQGRGYSVTHVLTVDAREGSGGGGKVSVSVGGPLQDGADHFLSAPFPFSAPTRTLTTIPSPTVIFKEPAKVNDDDSNGATTGRAISTPKQVSAEPYTDDDLDLLAIGFTVVKIFYLQGRLSQLPFLFHAIEGTRRRSLKPVHETSIRNEHAYYQCIGQVLSLRLYPKPLSPPAAPTSSSTSSSSSSPSSNVYFDRVLTSDPLAACANPWSFQSPLYAAAAANPLYICGDSHCLSPAWIG